MKVACNFDGTNSILSSVVQILPPTSGTPSINRGRVVLHRLGCGQLVLSKPSALTMPTNRNPLGKTALPLFIEGVPEGGGSICATRDYMLLALSNQFCISSSAWYAFQELISACVATR